MGLLVKRRVTLDLARRGTQATVPFSLGDRCAYEVIFTLRDGSEQVALPPGTSAAVTVRNGAGGTGCVDGCVIDHVNNNVIYTPTVDALSVEGNIECTLHLFDGDGGVIGAPTFIFAVSEGDKADTEGEVSKALVANPGWGIIADTENKAKEAAEAAAEAGQFASQASDEVAAAQMAAGEARAEADRARAEAELSKMWANGGILVDEPPSEVNNSYYWATVAADERMSAQEQVGLAAVEVDNAKAEVQNAAAEVKKAKSEAQTAEAEAIKARMWAVGETVKSGKRNPTDTNNAMYYSDKSKEYMNEAEKYTNMTLSLSVDREKHIYTVSLIRDGTVIGNPIKIDLPFEEVVVGGEYDDTYEELVLKLKNGESVRIPVGDIISPDDVVRRQYPGSYDAVYTETSSGEVVLLPVKVYSDENAGNTLVKRGSLGEIRTREIPEFDDEAAPKRYVDKVADKAVHAMSVIDADRIAAYDELGTYYFSETNWKKLIGDPNDPDNYYGLNRAYVSRSRERGDYGMYALSESAEPIYNAWYSKKEWATRFATEHPDEDFREPYDYEYPLLDSIVQRNADGQILVPLIPTLPEHAVAFSFVKPLFERLAAIEADRCSGTVGLAYALSEDGTHYICTGLGDVPEGSNIEVASYIDGIPVEEFAADAFREKTLGCITIPRTIKKFGRYAFANGSRDVNIKDLAKWANIEFASWNASAVNGNTGKVYINGLYRTDLIIPEGVGTIQPRAFVYFRQFTSVILPQSLNNITDMAFQYCEGVKEIVIPKRVVKVGASSFGFCKALKSVTFEGTPSAINANAFEGCTALTDIYVPWYKDTVANAPWGATNATVWYDVQADVVGTTLKLTGATVRDSTLVIPAGAARVEDGKLIFN